MIGARAMTLAGLGSALAGFALPWVTDERDMAGHADDVLVDLHMYQDVFLTATGLLLAWCLGTTAIAAWTATRLDR
jgi:hypothetical protein